MLHLIKLATRKGKAWKSQSLVGGVAFASATRISSKSSILGLQWHQTGLIHRADDEHRRWPHDGTAWVGRNANRSPVEAEHCFALSSFFADLRQGLLVGRPEPHGFALGPLFQQKTQKLLLAGLHRRLLD